MIRHSTRTFVLAFVLLALLVPPFVPHSGLGVQAAGTTITSVATGKWSDPNVWNLKRVPAPGDLVVINTGTTVTYDRFTDEEMARLTIKGKLSFSRATGTRLDTGNVTVESGGTLDMGTASEPIPPGIDAQLSLVVSPNATCTGGSDDVGVWVQSGGRWDINGAPVRHTWGKLVEDVSAGSTVVKVAENVSDWDPGSSILITSTKLGSVLNEFEVRQVSNISYTSGQSKITITQPLTYGHKGAVGVGAEVALLSRNVVVTSKRPEYPKLGHTIYLAGSTGSISHAEFRDLGMLGCLGRYPVHFHLMGDTSRGMTVRGASIWRSENHFLNIHGSNGVFIEDTVGYDAVGVGFFLGEPAVGMPSVDNVFIHNLAAKVYGQEGMISTDTKVTGFWIHNRNSVVIDNVASGSHDAVASGFYVSGEVVSGFQPLTMARNEAHSNKAFGLLAYTNAPDFFLILDFKGWRNGNAGILYGAYGPRFQIHRAKVFENQERNLWTSSMRTHVQDSELYGTTNVPTPMGIQIKEFAVPGIPTDPSKLLRNTFSGHKVDVSQDHDECQASQAEETNPQSKPCTPTYFVMAGNKFSAPVALDFGWQTNANSWWDVRSWSGFAAPAIAGVNFRLTRKDQPKPDSDAYYYGPFDSWLNPASTILGAVAPGVTGSKAPGKGGGGKGGGGGKPTPTPAPNPGGLYLLPTIAWLTPKEGDLLAATTTLEVTVTGTNPITKVDFFADGKLLVSDSGGAPYQYAWATSSWTRKRAYVHACVTDNAGNMACTPVLKLNRTAP